MNSATILFIFLTSLQIPSIFCAIQSIRSGRNKHSVKHLQNYVVACLLYASIWSVGVDLPFTQAYLWSGFVSIRTAWVCYTFNVSFYAMAGMNRILMAFMCIELFHYIPLLTTILFVLIYYIILHIFVTCGDLDFDYSRFMCGYTCAIRQENLAASYIWFDVFTPVLLTIIASILLPVRFVIQKRNAGCFQWHRARKMIIKTSLVAGVYIICWVSYMIVLQLLIKRVLFFSDLNVYLFFIYEPYATPLLTPFIIQLIIPGWLNRAVIHRIKFYLFPPGQSIKPRSVLAT